jgi:hypothetical protein
MIVARSDQGASSVGLASDIGLRGITLGVAESLMIGLRAGRECPCNDVVARLSDYEAING